MGGVVSGISNAVGDVSHGIGQAIEGVAQAPVSLYNGITGNNAGGLFPSYNQPQASSQSSGKGQISYPTYNLPQANTTNTVGNYSGMPPPGYAQNGQISPQLMSMGGGNYQNTITSGQPIMGQPNQYMNNVQSGGKGSGLQPLPTPSGWSNGKSGQSSASQNSSSGKL
jgi:hypothetical protein